MIEQEGIISCSTLSRPDPVIVAKGALSRGLDRRNSPGWRFRCTIPCLRCKLCALLAGWLPYSMTSWTSGVFWSLRRIISKEERSSQFYKCPGDVVVFIFLFNT